MLDPRGQLLLAALGFAGCSMPSNDRALWALRTWLDSWSGIGHVAVGCTDERDGHRVGAHAVARDAAGGVGDVEEVRGGQHMIRLAWWQPMLILAVGFFILAVAGGVLAFNEPDGFRGLPWGATEEQMRAAVSIERACIDHAADRRWVADRSCPALFDVAGRASIA